MDNFKEARNSLDKAIKLKPAHADAFFSRGNAHHYSFQYLEAISDYGAAIELRPDDPKAYVSRSEALTAINRLEDSVSSCDKAILGARDFCPKIKG